MKEIILASASPRRKQLLKMCNVSFKVIVPEVDENFQKNEEPRKIVKNLSKKKAMAVSKNFNGNNIILAADTIVTLNNQILTKPKDKEDCYKMLKKLSGTVHSVFTGVCLIKNKKIKSNFCSKTNVEFYSLSDEEINAYIKTKEPFDKAGAYAIQGAGAAFIKKINGDFYTVVGLPIAKVIRKLKSINF